MSAGTVFPVGPTYPDGGVDGFRFGVRRVVVVGWPTRHRRICRWNCPGSCAMRWTCAHDASGPRRDRRRRSLIDRYRAGGPAGAPILADRLDVLGYAAYRMPATYAAVRSALAPAAPGPPPAWRPHRLLDIGGGTGAAAWAAADAFPGLAEVTVLDQVPERARPGPPAGRRAVAPALRAADLGQRDGDSSRTCPAADLVTVSTSWASCPRRTGRPGRPGGRAARRRSGWWSWSSRAPRPATPGSRAARDGLLDAGLRVLAPCPHRRGLPDRRRAGTGATSPPGSTARPCTAGSRAASWATRTRSSPTWRPVAPARAAGRSDAGRVLRHPVQRKGLVTLRVCTVDGAVQPELVSKRQGERYRAARDTAWGDAWPPPPRCHRACPSGVRHGRMSMPWRP